MSESTEYTTVSVRMTEEKREKWEEYIPKCDAENVSQLVRMAVKHEIDGRADAPQSPENAIEPEVMGEVTDGINQLQKGLRGVKTRLSTIEKEVELTDTMDTEDAVFRALPTPPSDGNGVNQDEYNQWAATPDGIARQTARSVDRVEEALEHLENVSGQVRSVVGGPDENQYYWKRQ